MDREGRTFEALYRAHYNQVYAYACRRVDRDSARDVAAETFLVALRRPTEVPAADPLPWLLAVARKVIGNQLRARSRADRRLQALRSVRDGQVSADHAERVAQTAHVRDALARLSERDQEALRLVAWEGLTLARAAAAAECTTGAMAVRLHRARRRLAALLADDPDSGADPPRPSPSNQPPRPTDRPDRTEVPL